MKERETDTIITVGTIDLSDDYLNESKGSFGGNLNECDISVKGSEGPIPHFHIKSKDGSCQCCPCLYDALYFNHAEYQGKLSQKQKIALNNWMNKPNRKFPAYNNWYVLCSWWEEAGNPTINVPHKPKQPDYTKLENMIG